VCEGRGSLQVERSLADSLPCKYCAGKGAEPNSDDPCHLCKGLGQLTKEGYGYRIIPRDPVVPNEPIAPAGITLISQERLEELCKCKNPDLDYRKLIRLCEEINTCYAQGCFYAALMLIRAVIDHVAPVFQRPNFNEVANNYSGGGKSFKQAAEHLNNAARRFADSYLHVAMRREESIPTAQQVQFGPDLDFLLAEIIRITPKS
jgi:hypothetical protein